MLRIGIAAIALSALAGCSGTLTYKLASSSKAPGADVTITADPQKEQNSTALKIEAVNLPPPARVTGGATAYVVWYRKNSGATWNRVGQLAYDESSRKGTLQGSAPETHFELEVSVERDPSPGSPSSDIIVGQAIGNN